MTKAKIIFFCLFLFHSLSWGQRANETYPNKPIRLIVPLAAGSSVDTAARIVMQKVSQHFHCVAPSMTKQTEREQE